MQVGQSDPTVGHVVHLGPFSLCKVGAGGFGGRRRRVIANQEQVSLREVSSHQERRVRDDRGI